VGELPDGQDTMSCKNIPEKLNLLSRVHARHRLQTDGFAMPLATRNVVTFGQKEAGFVSTNPASTPIVQRSRYVKEVKGCNYSLSLLEIRLDTLHLQP